MGMIFDLTDPRYYDRRLFKSSPKVPAAPDPVKTAAAQTATNKETAYWNAVLNNVNQVTPYGNLTYTQTGGGKTYNQAAYDQALASYNQAIQNGAQAGAAPVLSPEQRLQNERNGISNTGNAGAYAGKMPQLSDFQTGDAPPSFTSTINLSPEQQKLLETQQRSDNALALLGEQQIGRISNAVSSPYSYDGLAGSFTNEDIATQQRNAEAALMSRLDPQFARDEEALRTRLINQGIGQGSQAYNTEFERFNQAKNDARTQAVLAGQQYGGTAQQQALQRRNQAISEYDAQRNAPLNEYIGLTSGQQVQNPQFSTTNYQGAQPVDYTGLVNNQYQAQLGQYNSKVASNNATSAGLFGLAGSIGSGFAGSSAGSAAIAGLFSDRRLKEDIELIGEENGLNIYKFQYKKDHVDLPSGTWVGVMSDEVRKVMPEAVTVDATGYDRVNYDMLGMRCQRVS